MKVDFPFPVSRRGVFLQGSYIYLIIGKTLVPVYLIRSPLVYKTISLSLILEAERPLLSFLHDEFLRGVVTGDEP